MARAPGSPTRGVRPRLSRPARRGTAGLAGLLSAALALSGAAHAAPFASSVIGYTPGGDGFSTGFDLATAALGEPTRSNGTGLFEGDVTPFNPPFKAEHVVSLGLGGELVVGFDQPVEDDPLNPFGIDLLVFGNPFLGLDFGSFTATGTISAEPGLISVSADGVVWVDVTAGPFADGLFPTLGFLDSPGPFDSGGSVPSDFTRPVDPSVGLGDFSGLGFADVVALYGGSGGGVGIDLADTGLASIRFVRISDPFDDGLGPDIDAFADVAPIPEPGGLPLAGVGVLGLLVLRRLCNSGIRFPA